MQRGCHAGRSLKTEVRRAGTGLLWGRHSPMGQFRPGGGTGPAACSRSRAAPTAAGRAGGGSPGRGAGGATHGRRRARAGRWRRSSADSRTRRDGHGRCDAREPGDARLTLLDGHDPAARCAAGHATAIGHGGGPGNARANICLVLLASAVGRKRDSHECRNLGDDATRAATSRIRGIPRWHHDCAIGDRGAQNSEGDRRRRVLARTCSLTQRGKVRAVVPPWTRPALTLGWGRQGEMMEIEIRRGGVLRGEAPRP